MDDVTIAIIEKNHTQDIRVRLAEFHDKLFVDLRLFVVADAADRVPTRKGIAIPPALLSGVIAALREAEHQARAARLIRDKGREPPNMRLKTGKLTARVCPSY